MFIEAFRKLSSFQKIEKYQYIGMGSTYFNDFILYHRNLGINDMISIEDKIVDKGRFNFNKPYSCIKIKYGTSNEVLPTLSWQKKSVIWLDFDGHLTKDVLSDINTVIERAKSGSFLVITVKAHPDNLDANNPNLRMENLTSRIGEDKIPLSTTDKSLTSKNLHKLYRTIMVNEIDSSLSKKNRILSLQNKMNYAQVFNITYQDNAKMLTIGGIVYSNRDKRKYLNTGIESLPYYSNSDTVFDIKVPNLTLKEIKYLDALLPNNIDIKTGIFKKNRKNVANLPIDDIINYSKIYRYFPTFAEALV